MSELLMWSSARLAVAGGERSSGIAEGGVKLFYSEVRPPRDRSDTTRVYSQDKHRGYPLCTETSLKSARVS